MRGEEGTRFIFHTQENEDCILARGSIERQSYSLSKDAYRGDSILYLDSATLFKKGDWVKVLDDDEELIVYSWAIGSTGQIVQIDNVDSFGRLEVSAPMRRAFTEKRGATVTKINPVSQIGIESIEIQCQYATEGQTSNIEFQYVVDGFVKCVQSSKTNFGYVNLVNSARVTVEKSSFFSAHAHEGGGQDYGVVLNFNTSECLIENNYMDSLRHSILLQAGVNGNVIAYNYSTRPYWTGVFVPSDAAGDLVLHGNFPYCNLFEGNIVENIVIDASHDINGPDNIFFRNRALGYGLFMDPNTPSDAQVFIGNEVVRTDPPYGLFLLPGEGHLVYVNNHRGAVIPPGTDSLPLLSLYLKTAPGFYSAHSSWPPIGFPNRFENYPNEIYWHLDQEIDLCAELVHAETSHIEDDLSLVLYPNPTLYVRDEKVPLNNSCF